MYQRKFSENSVHSTGICGVTAPGGEKIGVKYSMIRVSHSIKVCDNETINAAKKWTVRYLYNFKVFCLTRGHCVALMNIVVQNSNIHDQLTVQFHTYLHKYEREKNRSVCGDIEG